MARRSRVLRSVLVSALVFQFGLAGTLGWLHLAAHDHAFSPGLLSLVDAPASTPWHTGVSTETRAKDHRGVLLAISRGYDDRRPPMATLVQVPPPPVEGPRRTFVLQRNPRQEAILSIAPSQSPPPLA